MSEQDSSSKTVMAALFANLGIAATKFFAAAISGSAAMLAEAFHSTADTLNQIFLLYGQKRARKPADEAHPFGYAGEQFFWSFIVAILLFSLGAGLSIYEGIRVLLHGEHAEAGFPWIPVIVLAIAFAFESYSWRVAWGEFNERRRGEGLLNDIRSLKDPSIFVVLFEDSAALAGIIVAVTGILLAWMIGSVVPDGIASICVGLVLGATSVMLAIEIKGLLIGESAPPELSDAARDMAAGYDEVNGINEVRTLHIGPHDVLLSMSADFIDSTTAGRIEEIVTELEKRLRERFDIIKTVFIEVQSRSGHEQMRES